MNKYELYNRVLEALNEDEGTFNAVARNWVEGADSANFDNTEACELFMRAKQCDAAWRSKAINGRISKRRMIEYVRQIAVMDLPNPYDPNEIVEEPKIAEEVKEEHKEEPVHVLGVVPEEEEKEEKSIFKRKKK